MKITITGAKQTPNWRTLEKVVQQIMQDRKCRISRLVRPDGKYRYHDLGRYEVDCRMSDGSYLCIDFVVK